LKDIKTGGGSLFTQNIEFFISEKTKWLKRYEYAHQYPTSTLSFTMTASYDPPATPFREPLILMAEMRAYFEVVYRVRYVLEQSRYAAISLLSERMAGLTCNAKANTACPRRQIAGVLDTMKGRQPQGVSAILFPQVLPPIDSPCCS
jgi:hypothetical protein